MLSNKLSALNYNQIIRLFSTMKFTKTHEWIKLDGDVATIGVTDHAQKELGDIVFIELPKPNTTINAGDSIANIETVKTVASVYSCLPGTVIEGNKKLNEDQKLINRSPEDQGWIAKLKVNHDDAQKEMDKLLSLEDYKKLL